MFSLAELESAIPLVRQSVPPTPQYAWPLLRERFGAQVLVKHENHTPIGSFKVRGGIVFFDRLKRHRPEVRGIISATRGNHGQSLAFAGARAGVAVTIVVPRGNSTEKNAAMRSFGAELIEHGRDFDEAREHAVQLAAERGLEFAPSFHRDLVLGVATYAYELFTSISDLDTVYVPIGLGSGICGVIGARDALGRKARIVGVVAEGANTYARSVAAGRIVPTNSLRLPSPTVWQSACQTQRLWRLFSAARIELWKFRMTRSRKPFGSFTAPLTTVQRVLAPRRLQRW